MLLLTRKVLCFMSRLYWHFYSNIYISSAKLCSDLQFSLPLFHPSFFFLIFHLTKILRNPWFQQHLILANLVSARKFSTRCCLPMVKFASSVFSPQCIHCCTWFAVLQILLVLGFMIKGECVVVVFYQEAKLQFFFSCFLKYDYSCLHN